MLRSMHNRAVGVSRFRRRAEALWLAEAGLPQPKSVPLGHDPVDGAERLGAAVEQPEGDDLSDAWYASTAERLVLDYDRYVELNWEPTAVKSLCSAMRLTSGVVVDEDRLLSAVGDAIKARDDRAAKRVATDERAGRSEMPLLRCQRDPVLALLNASLTPAQYAARAATVFKVQTAPALHEGRCVRVPSFGALPHGGAPRVDDERALDLFCAAWSRGSGGMRASWYPGDRATVAFVVEQE